jgi:hypothetical protein
MTWARTGAATAGTAASGLDAATASRAGTATAGSILAGIRNLIADRHAAAIAGTATVGVPSYLSSTTTNKLGTATAGTYATAPRYRERPGGLIEGGTTANGGIDAAGTSTSIEAIATNDGALYPGSSYPDPSLYPSPTETAGTTGINIEGGLAVTGVIE